MAGYGSMIQRAAGADPLVPQPMKGKTMATPDAATMRNLVKQGKAMPAPGQARPGRFNIRNAAELDAAIQTVGRVPAAGRPKVRKFIMARAKALGLSSRIPDAWDSSGNLKDDGDSSSDTSQGSDPGMDSKAARIFAKKKAA